MGAVRRAGVAPKVARTLSCRMIDNPKVATMDNAAAFLIGWITVYSITAPMAKPRIGTMANASQ